MTRASGLVLATLALALLILSPPGFMVTSGLDGAALVVCTGHGPLVSGDLAHPGKAPPASSDRPCVFAGHAATLSPGLDPIRVETPFTFVAVPTQLQRDLTPGRGLAAPPPPSQGPPDSI